MSEPVRLRVLVDGVEVKTPSAVLSYDGCNAFHPGDVVNGAVLQRRVWTLSGEGRFELALECESEAPRIRAWADGLPPGPDNVNEALARESAEAIDAQAVMGAAFGVSRKKGKHGRRR